ncbi:hypothetical protein BDD12DRAFT_839886 [Trichophaea hybrida]|nr:hypothetical protein BDD12DRAFT_839886 [Trichophaea hybrida]
MGVKVKNTISFFVVNLIMMVLATILCPLRFYLLRKQRRSTLALWCDIWCLFGWVLLQGIGWYLVQSIWEEIQFRKSAVDISNVTEQYGKSKNFKGFLVFYIFVVTILWAFKIAFLFMYADLYQRTVNIRRYPLYFAFAFIPLSYVGLIVASFMECRPLGLNWDVERLRTTGEYCTPLFRRRTNNISVSLAVTTDILLIALPISILASLRLTSPEKRGIILMFVIAAISIIAAVGRYVVLSTRGMYNGRALSDPVTSFDNYYLAVTLAILEILAMETAFVLPAMKRVVLERKRRKEDHRDESTATEVRLVSFVEVGDGDALVDRPDPEAPTWGWQKSN